MARLAARHQNDIKKLVKLARGGMITLRRRAVRLQRELDEVKGRRRIELGDLERVLPKEEADKSDVEMAEAEVEAAESNEPKSTETEVKETDATEPEAMESVIKEPESTELERREPEIMEPETMEPEKKGPENKESSVEENKSEA